MRDRAPVDAILCLGRKGPKGGVIEREMFHFVEPTMDAATKRRAHHTDFAAFNRATEAKRKMVRGVFVHTSWADCYGAQLGCYRNKTRPESNPKAKRPFCSGNGLLATRWTGKQFEEIECPNDRCEFRIGNVRQCTPDMSLLFRPRWPEGNPLPTPLVRWNSKSWNNASIFAGWIKAYWTQCDALGVTRDSLYGFPFRLEVEMVTGEKSKYPIVRISNDGIDVQSHLLRQRAMQRELQAQLGDHHPTVEMLETLEEVEYRHETHAALGAGSGDRS